MTRTTRRVARKVRRCDGCGVRVIRGAVYLEHVASPGHDGLANDHWWRITECRGCAARYGRADLLAGKVAA